MGEMPIQNITCTAGADLQAARYLAVKMTVGGLVKSGAGENAIGILQNTPDNTQAATVMCLGLTLAKFGGVVAKGANLASDANGKLVTAGGGTAIIGIAMEAGAADEIHTVLLVTRTSSGVTGLANARAIMTIPVTLSKMDNGEVVTDFIPGFAGEIEKFSFITGSTPASTAGKTADLTLNIEAAAVTGGELALTTAGCDTMGKVVEAAAITGDNVFTAAQKISVLVGNTATPFIEGDGMLVLVLKQ